MAGKQNDSEGIPSGMSARLQYYILRSSFDIHETVMVPLYSHLLSGCSVLVTPESVEDVQVLVRYSDHCYYHYNVRLVQM